MRSYLGEATIREMRISFWISTHRESSIECMSFDSLLLTYVDKKEEERRRRRRYTRLSNLTVNTQYQSHMIAIWSRLRRELSSEVSAIFRLMMIDEQFVEAILHLMIRTLVILMNIVCIRIPFLGDCWQFYGKRRAILIQFFNQRMINIYCEDKISDKLTDVE